MIILTQISNDPTDLQRDTQLNLVHELYTWYPVWQSENCGQFKEFVLLDRWGNNGNKNYQNLINYVPLGFLKSFGGCNAYYATYEEDKKYLTHSLELLIIEALLNSLNLKLQYLKNHSANYEVLDMVILKTGSGYYIQITNV